MVQLQSDLEEFESAGIQIIALSFDSVAILADFSAKNGMGYPLLSDPDSKTIAAYGILASAGQGVSQPQAFLLDAKGVIRAKLNLEWYVGPPLTEALLAAAKP